MDKTHRTILRHVGHTLRVGRVRSDRLLRGCFPAVVFVFASASANGAPDGPPSTKNTAPAKPHPRVIVHGKPKALSVGAVTHDWPTLLGPTHDGISTETKLATRWAKEGPKLIWEMEKGSGFSSPAVMGDRVVFFHRMGDEEIVECLQTETGQRYWSVRYPSAYEDRYGFNNGPRGSPVIDDNLVFTLGAEGKLHCIDLLTGEIVWQLDTKTRFNVPKNYFGVGSTPLVHEDRLIVQVGGDGGPCAVAFDKRTGKLLWQSGDQWRASYASPIPAVIHGAARIAVFAGGDVRPPTGGLLLIDPTDGGIDWRFPFRGKRYESINAANPVVVGNRIFLTTSYGTGAVLLEAPKTGEPKVVWKTDALGCHFATPIHKDGFLYGIDEPRSGGSAVVCIDLKDGKEVWRNQPTWEEAIPQNGKITKRVLGVFRGSLMRVDPLFLCLGEWGHLLWLDLSPDGYKQVSRAWLFAANESWTPPALSKGLLYVVQNTRDITTGKPPRLLCYDLRADH
ncbi:MAG: PQQ-like beta-propeller repeat protein [Planctomycetes bacterium]|nr:PQQ-like beta-propeller repeat protein [Planctomycetota bacterium]